MFADERDKDTYLIEQQQAQINSLMRERDQLRDQVLRYTEIIGHLEEEVKRLQREVYAWKEDERCRNFGPLK